MGSIVDAHRASGSFFDAEGVRSFRLDEGDGDPVVLMHGVPASCFLYRKVVPALAQRGLRGLAFDLPGLGLADRPEDFDYSWTGLGRFATAAVQALGLPRFHLVVKSFEPTPEKSALYQSVVASDRYPKQVVWGDKDPALTYAFHGKIAERLTSTTAEKLPAKHFLQEDQYDAVAEAIRRLAS